MKQGRKPRVCEYEYDNELVEIPNLHSGVIEGNIICDDIQIAADEYKQEENL
jgi:hypothetical protein